MGAMGAHQQRADGTSSYTRTPLHESGMHLLAKYHSVVEDETPVSEEASSSTGPVEREDVVLVREKIKLAEIEERKFMRELEVMQMRKEEQNRQQNPVESR